MNTANEYTNEQLLTEVLQYLNAAREALGDAPLDKIPTGRRHHPTCCPVATALKYRVKVTASNIEFAASQLEEANKVAAAWHELDQENRQVRVEDFRVFIDCPDALSAFIYSFDNGSFEQFTTLGTLSK